jgi:hypothetical protein
MSLLDELEALVELGLKGDDATWKRALAALATRHAPRALHEEAFGDRRLRVLAGQGMLRAKTSFRFTDEYGDRHVVIAGRTRVAPDHELARRHPELFKVAWREDMETAMRHRHNLRERMKELRDGEAPAPARPTARPDWYIG